MLSQALVCKFTQWLVLSCDDTLWYKLIAWFDWFVFCHIFPQAKVSSSREKP